MSRTVAIVGQPNVGKSALFNRLAGRRISIVHDQPGVTRDRLTAECKLGDKPFTVVDTGGIGSTVDASFTEQVHVEADIAITTADLILLVVDAQMGLTPVDSELARELRRSKKPLILVVNKIDDAKHQPLISEFSRLGFDTLVAISAEHGRGIDYLIERIAAFLPEPEAATGEASEPPLAIAIVGRPNVGKSSLINAILQDQRTIVSDISGTTRDAVDVPYVRDGRGYVLIDTAGIRPRGKVATSVEVFSVMRSEKSIRRADLCVLVIDATAGVTAQDKKIAGMIQEAQKPCVVVMNKWDVIEEGRRQQIMKEAMAGALAELFFLDYAPVIVLSAKTGERVKHLFREIDLVRDAAQERIGTGPLNRVMSAALTANPPPIRVGKRFKLLYATQIEKEKRSAIPVPAFLFFVNASVLLVPAYRKFLENQIRKVSPFAGLPILFHFRQRETREVRKAKRGAGNRGTPRSRGHLRD